MGIFNWEDTLKIMGMEILHPGGIELTMEFAQLMNFKKDENVLEVGSGSGKTANILASKYGINITGVDYSDYMVSYAQEKAKEQKNQNKIKFMKADAHSLPFEDNLFDAAYSESAVYQFDVKKAIGEIARVVKPGGRIGIHDMYWWNTPSKDIDDKFFKANNYHLLDENEWCNIFEECGLNIEHFDKKTDMIYELYKKMDTPKNFFKGVGALIKILFKFGFGEFYKAFFYDYFLKNIAQKYVGYFIIIAKKSN